MTLVSRLVSTISDELNDREIGHEHVRWTIVDLLEYITEAVSQISAIKPELFSVTQTIQLKPGTAQVVPLSIAKLIDVTNNVDRKGQLGTSILKNDYTLMRYFNKPSCSVGNGGEVASFKVDPNNPRVFYVSPSVVEYPPQYVQILGQSTPVEVVDKEQELVFTGGDAALYFNAMKDWALYRAFMRDTESQSSLQRSRIHYDAFYHFFGIKSSMTNSSRTQNRQAQQPQQVAQDVANI